MDDYYNMNESHYNQSDFEKNEDFSKEIEEIDKACSVSNKENLIKYKNDFSTNNSEYIEASEMIKQNIPNRKFHFDRVIKTRACHFSCWIHVGTSILFCVCEI